MARYKTVERGGMLIPVVLHEEIQGHAAQAAVNSVHQIIVAAEVAEAHALITAGAGYHSDANI